MAPWFACFCPPGVKTIMRRCFLAVFVLQLGCGLAFGEDGLDGLARAQDGRSRRASSTDPNIDANGDGTSPASGETVVVAELDGPGVIKHIWCTAASLNPLIGRAMVLRIYWDGAERPSVEVPLGDFFGVGHGATKSFQSLPVGVSSYGRSRNCFWRMPFRKHAKITVTNESEPRFGPAAFYYYVDWEQVDELPEDSLYFHARYRQQTPAQPGDHVLLETEGRGHYAGTVYSAHQTRTGWFGEGDDRFAIDGESVPSIQGTGTEDYFGDAWGFREFAGPYYGVSLYEGPMLGDRVTAYRWHVEDPIRFSKSLKFSIEHRGSVFTEEGKQLSSSGQREDWVSSVAMWYQTPVATWDEELPPAKERVAPYQIVLASELAFEAKPDKTKKSFEGITFRPEVPDGTIQFDFEVEKAGLYKVSAILLKTIAGGRYQVLLDGQQAGPVLDLNGEAYDWQEYAFDLHRLKAGQHTLEFVGRGASDKQRSFGPKLYEVGVSTLLLLRMEDMAGYKAE